MAYTLVSYGSCGENVKKLQSSLNEKGYSLEVDGQFGSKTQAAVQDYQQKNGLTVDGKVGNETWGSLLGTGSDTSTASASSQTAATPQISGISNGKALQTGFTPSAQVTEAKAKYEALQSVPTEEYNSQYAAHLEELMQQLEGREKFTYDMTEDPTFQSLKRQYGTMGQLAMEDTMGAAAALTGGYGSSYSQTAGQQQYNAYLSKLWEQVPTLQQNAYARYSNETDDLYRQYELYRKAEKSNRETYDTEQSARQAAVDSAYKTYRDLYESEREMYENDRDYALKIADMENDDYWKSVSTAKSSSSSGSSGSSSRTSGSSGAAASSDASSSEESSLTYENVRQAIERQGNLSKANLLTERGYNALRRQDEKLGTISVASQSRTYQRYLAEMMKQYA